MGAYKYSPCLLYTSITWKDNDKNRIIKGIPNRALLSTGGYFELDTTKLKPGADTVSYTHLEGPYIDKLLRSTNFDDYDSLKYFQENLRKNKVVEKLEELGAHDGCSVFIGEYEFEFFE